MEEQVRAAAEHKLGVANQSITAGFFDNNTRYVFVCNTCFSVEVSEHQHLAHQFTFGEQ